MDDAFALLRLQAEWGADEAIDVDPIDRLRPLESKPDAPKIHVEADPEPAKGTQGTGTLGTGTPGTGISARGTPAERAAALAGQAASLEDLRAAIAGFDGCALRDTASNLVFAEGDATSTTLLIGEAPGREEDRSGHPFAGSEGQLLDQMLGSIGLSRTELMLTPLLPWRPPGGRPPSPNEIATCLPFLHRLIVLLGPRRAVLFGGLPVRALLAQAAGRRRNPRGWVEASVPGRPASLPVLALPGLGEMLKNPPVRRDAWAGLRMLRRSIDGTLTPT